MTRQENVFGLPVTVHDTHDDLLQALADAGDDRPRLAVLMRCADFPAWQIPEPVRSRNRRTGCDKCLQMCWLDPKYAIPGLRVLCTHCAPADLRISSSAEQVAEVRDVFGDDR